MGKFNVRNPILLTKQKFRWHRQIFEEKTNLTPENLMQNDAKPTVSIRRKNVKNFKWPKCYDLRQSHHPFDVVACEESIFSCISLSFSLEAQAIKIKRFNQEWKSGKSDESKERNERVRKQQAIPATLTKLTKKRTKMHSTRFLHTIYWVCNNSALNVSTFRKWTEEEKKTPSTKNKIMATHCLHIWNNSIIAWICVYGLGDARAMLLLLLVRWRDRVVSVAGVPRSVKNSINYHWWDIDESDSFPWRDDNDNDNFLPNKLTQKKN